MEIKYQQILTVVGNASLTFDMNYYVYVIELDKSVGKIIKFRKQNPSFILGERCFYVGQTAKKPIQRLQEHKRGYKSNSYAKKYGIRLRPEFYDKYNPIPTRKDAEDLESHLTIQLRKKGYGVWSN